MSEKDLQSLTEHTRLSNKRILLAEDIKMNQYIAKRILESWGCDVTIANNGKEAVNLLTENYFDCILMDVQMPELDGVSATEMIRKLPDSQKSSIPIIALTANTLDSDKNRYMKAGMNACISKPINEEKLLAVITKNILSSQKEKENVPEKKTNQQNSSVEKLYDLSMVVSVSGGNHDFIKKMIALFIETVPQNIYELKTSAEAGNWDQVGKIAHKLKSTIDSMGIKSIHQDIRSIEAGAKQKTNLENISTLVEKVKLVIDHTIQQLQTEL
ncbi:MAG TPA: response regulator [Puia sp.]|nr:response regulator [Puia sp.]